MYDEHGQDTIKGELFGFLKASIGTLAEDIREIKDSIKHLHEEQQILRQEIEAYKIRGELVLKIVKWTAGSIATVISVFNFTNIKAAIFALLGK